MQDNEKVICDCGDKNCDCIEKYGRCDCDAIHIETVERVRAHFPDINNLKLLSRLYKVIADDTRLKILWALSLDDLCVCDLAALLDMTKSAISHQLKILRDSNLVKFDKRGKVAFYSLSDNHVRDIFEKGFEHIKHK